MSSRPPPFPNPEPSPSQPRVGYGRELLAIGIYLCRWLIITLPVGIAVGSACALFLWMLHWATQTRWDHPWLLFTLPLAGLAMAWMYQLAGKQVARGHNLIMDEIHQPGGGVPVRMAPLVLIATCLTHLSGGSAGREGTAIQMGGALASGYARLLPRFPATDVPILLMAGIAAGFGGVFGTPLAGAIFALEVLALGRMNYRAVIPCLLAAAIADRVTHLWGAAHTTYPQLLDLGLGDFAAGSAIDWLLLAKVVLAAAICGLVSRLFATLTHGVSDLFAKVIRQPLLRPVVGGFIIIALVYLTGTRDYLGLGVTSPDPDGVSIVSAFNPGGAEPWSWALKLLFTAITLGAAFKGGEVTPLFFIGATLGNTLAWMMDAPVPLFAAIGFVAVFAGATNTPLACTLMAAELFGTGYIFYFGAACFIAFLTSGHSSIYASQRLGVPKYTGFSPIGPDPNASPRQAYLQKAAAEDQDPAAGQSPRQQIDPQD